MSDVSVYFPTTSAVDARGIVHDDVERKDEDLSLQTSSLAAQSEQWLKLATGAMEQPRFSLTLLLSQVPDPLDREIAPHVHSALLSMDMIRPEHRFLPIDPLAHKLDVCLADQTDAVLAKTCLAGFVRSGALTCALGRDHALQLLSALQGEESGLQIIGCTHGASVPALHSNGQRRSISLTAFLEPLWRGRDFEPTIAIIAPGVAGYSPFRQVQRLRENFRRRDVSDRDDGPDLMLRENRIVTIDTDLRAARIGKAHLLMSSDLASPAKTIGAKYLHAAVQDLVISSPQEPLQSFPVVRDASSALWDDGVDASIRWYAPSAELIKPAPADTGDQTFHFTFRRIGTTPDGQPALAARLRLSLELAPSAEVQAAISSLPAGVAARPVIMEAPSATISIPFTDSQTGQLRRSELVASATISGNRVAIDVDLIGDTVRLAYGALAFENFQPEPLRVSLAYAFQAYVPVPVSKNGLQTEQKQ